MTQIFNDDGFYNFSTGELISSEELECDVPRDVGSVWEALEPGEVLSLADGDFILDKDLNLLLFVGYNSEIEALYEVDDGVLMDGYDADQLEIRKQLFW